MNIWAIADLHLSFGCENKTMDIFGPQWVLHHKKIQTFWDTHVQKEDLVLIPGDISWAKTLEEAKKDIQWLDERPGTKVIIKGNHEYWWPSMKKLLDFLPPSIIPIHNTTLVMGDIAICGTRLWDDKDIDCSSLYSNSFDTKLYTEQDEKIFERELMRLEKGLKQLPQSAKITICMTHFPPIDPLLNLSRAGKLLEEHGIDFVLFGHLHNVSKEKKAFGKRNKTHYLLTSCDYLNFTLLKVFSS